MLGGKGLSFLWKVVLAQAGPSALGFVQLSLVSLTLLANLCLLGLQTTIIRFIAIMRQRKQPKAADAVLLFTFKVSMSVALVLSVVVWVLPSLARDTLQLHSLSDTSIRLLMGALPFFVASELLVSYFNATQQMVRYGLGKYVLQPFFRLLLLFVVLFSPFAPEFGVVLHIVLAGVLSTVVLFAMSMLWKDRSRWSVSLEDSYRQEFLDYSVPVAGSFLLFIAYGTIDTFLISRSMAIEYVGLYSALLLLVELTDVVFLPSLNLLYAHLGSFEKNLAAGTRFVVEKMAVFVVLALLVFMAMALFKDTLITFILGSEYMSISVFVLPLLVAKLLETTLLFPLRHLLDFYGYVRLTLGFMTITLLTKIIAGAYFTHLYGIWGLVLTVAAVNTLHVVACIVALGVILRFQVLRSSQTL